MPGKFEKLEKRKNVRKITKQKWKMNNLKTKKCQKNSKMKKLDQCKVLEKSIKKKNLQK